VACAALAYPFTFRDASPALTAQAPAAAGAGILLIVADDMSVSDLALCGVNPAARVGLTPNLDRLAASGILFENAWANPLCSATRAMLLTGRHAHRTRIGNVIEKGTVSLAESETTLPEALRAFADPGYSAAAFGKWHLELPESQVECPATELHGFD
jgi:arylsulfatase A-like enzyme